MFAQERHRLILDLLEKHSPVAIANLEKEIPASPATLRRDLTFLEKLGKIVRTHGAVLHPDDVDPEISFDRKSRAALDAKLAIAEKAVHLAKGVQTVFVDAGSTTFELGRRLLRQEKLTIFTNSIPLLQERPADETRLISVGGEVRPVSLALVGGNAIQWLQRLRIDMAFMGTSGIEPGEGPTTTELSEASVKATVIARARRIVLLADGSKWDQPAAVRYAGWNEIQDLVTDYTFSRRERTLITRAGTHIHCVP